MRLAEASPGDKLRIKSIMGGKGLFKKLRDMGLHRGDVVQVRVNTGHGPIMVYHETIKLKFALGRGICSKIEVEKVG